MVLRRLVAWLTVVCGVVLLVSFTSFSQSGFTISGIVMDDAGGFVRATVRLFSADRVRGITTDDHGNFVFTDVSPGTYDLEAGGDSWTWATTEGIRVTDRNLTQLSLIVRPGTTSGRCVISISGSAARASGLFYDRRVDETNLIGMALDPSGAALADATLVISSANQTWTVTSNDKGVAQFVGLEPGKYTLKLSHVGYLGELVSIRVTRENLTRITVVLEPTGACH